MSDILYLINSPKFAEGDADSLTQLDEARISFIRGRSRLALSTIDPLLRKLDPSTKEYCDVVALRLLIVAMTGRDTASLPAEASTSFGGRSTALDIMVLCLRANECWRAGDLIQGLWLNKSAVEQARDAAPIWKFYSNFLLAKRLIDLHVPYQADLVIRDTCELARSAGLFVFKPMLKALEALRHWQEGRLDQAEHAAQLTIRLSQQYTSTFGVKIALSVLAMVHLGREEWEKAADLLEACRVRSELYGMPDSVARAACGEVALAYALEGARAGAARIRERWAALGVGSGFSVEDPARPAWLVAVAREAGDLGLARRLLRETEKFVENNRGVTVLITAAAYARDVMEGNRPELPTVLPYVRPAAPKRQRASPSPQRPDAPREDPTTQECGRDEACTETGEQAPLWSSLVALLTAREHEIARLVGHGMTNQQMALQLGISPHTVSFHLRNIFRKLSISTRVRLSSIMAQVESGTAGDRDVGTGGR